MCGLCQFERQNHDIIERAVEIGRRVNPENSPSPTVDELLKMRSELYKLFDIAVPESRSLQARVFPFDTPHQFSFARFIKLVLSKLVSNFQQQKALNKSIPYCVEYFAVTKGHLSFCDNLFEPGTMALYTWNHVLCQIPVKQYSPLRLAWLDELRRVCAMIGGKHYFVGKGTNLCTDELEEMMKDATDAEMLVFRKSTAHLGVA